MNSEEQIVPKSNVQLPLSRVTAYTDSNRLCILGIHKTPWGIIPIAHYTDIGEEIPDGPVILDDELHPAIESALDQITLELKAITMQETIQLAVEDLVRSARAGDQNAMSMISVLRDSAMKKKNKRSVLAFGLLNQYIKSHPVGSTKIGGEAATSKTYAVTSLANGPIITGNRIKGQAASFGNEKKEKLFLFGCRNFNCPKNIEHLCKRLPGAKGIIEMGSTLGKAAALQRVRQPNSRISDFCPMAGWELGE